MARLTQVIAASSPLSTVPAFLGFVLALTAPVKAATFYETWIAGGAGAPPCYARIYDAKHLAAHPNQRLTSFALSASSLGAPVEPGSFEVTFTFTLKGNDEVYQSEAICRDAAKSVHCGVEGDGGDFSVRADGSNLLLTVGKGLVVEGSDSSPDLAVGGDDRVVRLFRSPAGSCRFK